MKNITNGILTMALVLLSFSLKAQYDLTRPKSTLVRDHSTGQEYRRFSIDEMRLQVHDENLNRSKKNQGVIGNNFFNEIEIGRAQNDNPWQISGTPTDYQPIDGYKRTLTGLLTEVRYNPGQRDDDLNLIIRVDTLMDLLQKHKNYIIPQLRNNPERPWSVVFGEIDILYANSPWKSHYEKNHKNMPSVGDSVSLFGPWVLELYDNEENSLRFIGKGYHANFHEIHPAEQVWWVKNHKDSTIYNFILANDASGRFDERSDFTAWGDTELKNNWVKKPLNGIFAIPFTFNLKGPMKQFELEIITAFNVLSSQNEPSIAYLKYKNNTLVTVKQTGQVRCKISFENVGYNPISYWENDNKTDIISGFLIIQSNIIGIPGNLKMRLKETQPITKKAMIKTPR